MTVISSLSHRRHLDQRRKLHSSSLPNDETSSPSQTITTQNFGMTMSSSCSMNCLTDICYVNLELCQEIPPDFTCALVPEYNVDICLYTLLAMLHNAQLLKSVLKRDF
ncbi:hypothetical protein CsatB_021002 [Cannabis sativa]